MSTVDADSILDSVLGSEEVAIVGALPPTPTDDQSTHTVGLAAVQQPLEATVSSRVFTASRPARPKSAGKSRARSATSNRSGDAPFDSSVLTPLSSGMPDSLEALLAQGPRSPSFNLSMPAAERNIPAYDGARDPALKALRSGPVALKAQRKALRAAAEQQRKAIVTRREREYDKTMRAANARRAGALVEKMEHERWLPSGAWLPPTLPPHAPLAHETRPPAIGSGPAGVPAILSGLARGDPAARDAVLSQIALVPPSAPTAGARAQGRPYQPAPASLLQRSSARHLPSGTPPAHMVSAPPLGSHNRLQSAAGARAGGMPNDSSMFGTPFVRRVVSLLEGHEGDDVSLGASGQLTALNVEQRVFAEVASYERRNGSPEGARAGGRGRGRGGRGGVGRGATRLSRPPGGGDVGGTVGEERPGWWDSRRVQRYLREPAGSGSVLDVSVSLDELCAMLDGEMAMLDSLLEDGGESHLDELAAMLHRGNVGGADAADAPTLVLAEAEESRGTLRWMRANLELMRHIEAADAAGGAPSGASAEGAADDEATATAEGGVAVDAAAKATAAAEALEPEAIAALAAADGKVGHLELAQTPAESGVPAVMHNMPPPTRPVSGGVDGRLLAGEHIRLGPLQMAAHACVAEMEQNAAADAEAFRPSELRRVAVDAARQAVDALSNQPASAVDAADPTADAARRRLASMSDELCASLRARIKTLGGACALPTPSIEAAIRAALEASTAERDAEVAMSHAAMAVSKMMNAGGGGGGVVLGTAVVGAEAAQLAWLLLALRRHATRTRSVRLAIGQRELLVDHLRKACARLAPMHAAERSRSRLDAGSSTKGANYKHVVGSVEAEIVSTVALLRQATVRVTEAVVAWRGGLTSQAPFGAPNTAGPTAAPHHGDDASGDEGEEPASPAAGPQNYVLHMASDLDDVTQLSVEMPGVLHEAPARLDRRRLWRARQVIDLEAQTEQRAAQQAPDGALALRWSPLPTGELRKVGDPAMPCLFDVAAVDDDELLLQLRA